MFDAHIQYYCYDNSKRDDFGVGYIGNKEFWIHLINTWNKNDKVSQRFHLEDWDELDGHRDFRGCILAEVEPEGDSNVVTWQSGDTVFIAEISKDGTISWVQNDTGNLSVPRWVTRLKNQLREQES